MISNWYASRWTHWKQPNELRKSIIWGRVVLTNKLRIVQDENGIRRSKRQLIWIFEDMQAFKSTLKCKKMRNGNYVHSQTNLERDFVMEYIDLWRCLQSKYSRPIVLKLISHRDVMKTLMFGINGETSKLRILRKEQHCFSFCLFVSLVGWLLHEVHLHFFWW